ncbi:MAG: glycosyltransferase family 4 protein [Candidatus Krumholzibacteriota bacterium]|nr:glycosyltransferase family 4 protein [Candidatus Krumholzibacteriota bacterium]
MSEGKGRLLAVNWRDLRNPDAGGAEVHLHEILVRLARWGWGVTLLAAGWPGAAREERYDGLRVVRAGVWWNANWSLALAARRLLRDEPFDAVVEDVNKIPFFLPLVTSRPHLLVIPHLFGTTVFRETNPLFAAYVYAHELLIPRVYRRSRVLAISPSTRDDLVRRGFEPERVTVSYCGFDAAPYDLPAPPPRDAAPRLVHLGRLRRYKGVDLVLRAMTRIRAELPAATLDVVGDGPERPALAALAARLGLEDAVRFHGHLPQADMVDLLYRCRLFLNASPKEGWGLTVVEAGACGLPTVAADSPGLRDSVRDGETGVLVPYGDVPAMAAAAVALLGDEDRRRAMGEAAARRARSFSWETTARETEALLASLLEGGKSGPHP